MTTPETESTPVQEDVATEPVRTESIQTEPLQPEKAPAEKRERVRSTLKVADHVAAGLAEVKENTGAYAALVQQFAVLLQTSGLGQTLAFLKTVPGPASEKLAQHLSVWVLRDRRSAGPDLLEALIRRTNAFHEEALDETLAWIKETKQQLAANGQR